MTLIPNYKIELICCIAQGRARETSSLWTLSNAADVRLVYGSLIVRLFLSQFEKQIRYRISLFDHAASFRPSFSGVVCPVWIRHRSTASRRARATMARFLAERWVPLSTCFHRSSAR